jgi:hypothetical protein
MMLQDNVLKNISDIDGQIEDFKAKNDQCTKKFLNVFNTAKSLNSEVWIW